MEFYNEIINKISNEINNNNNNNELLLTIKNYLIKNDFA